jgi:hypothetical protein
LIPGGIFSASGEKHYGPKGNDSFHVFDCHCCSVSLHCECLTLQRTVSDCRASAVLWFWRTTIAHSYPIDGRLCHWQVPCLARKSRQMKTFGGNRNCAGPLSGTIETSDGINPANPGCTVDKFSIRRVGETIQTEAASPGFSSG